MALDVIVLTYADEIHPSWNEISSAFPHAKSIPLTDENVFKKILNYVNTSQFWIILPEISISAHELNFDPDIEEKKFINLFKSNNSDSFSLIFMSRLNFIKFVSSKQISSIFDLFSKNTKIHDVKKGISILSDHDINQDIIFISYFEPNAENKFNDLVSQFGERVKWVKDIKGIVNAHIKAAEISSTHSFYVVDADAEIYDSFNFDFKNPNLYNAVFIWKSKNPLNGLEYGYGGIKLFNKYHFLNVNNQSKSFIDFTTSIARPIIIDEIVCETRFNVSPLSTWRSAFRECSKLASAIIENSSHNEEILNVWTTQASGDFALYCIHGAKCGKEFGSQNKNNKDMLNRINDFEWLESEFRSYFGF